MEIGTQSRLWILILIVTAVVCACLLFWKHAKQGSRIPAKVGAESMLTVSSLNFPDHGEIPKKFTCDGEDVSPQLSISSVPAAAKSLALIMEDPDAPGGTFTHWVLFNLPVQTRDLAEGANPGGAKQGKNDFQKNGYGGPCPPPGNPHHYIFHIYALDSGLDLPEGATREQVESALDGHVLAEGTLTGLYARRQ
jgi:Raf kinase inhibitor-like YbhB/YbcL family protein